MFKTWRNLQYYCTLNFKVNESRGHLFERMANVFIFVGNVFILLFPSILNILIMGL